MKYHCKIIAMIGMILCIISTIYYAWQTRFGTLMMFTLIIGGVLTYMVYVPWSALAEILERLENLEWQLANTTTEVKQETESIFTAAHTFRGTSDIDDSGHWKCPYCGTINAGYVGTCKCGGDKSANGFLKQEQTETIERIQIKPRSQTELQPQLKQDPEPKLQEEQKSEQELQPKPEVQLQIDESKSELDSQSQPELQSEPQSNQKLKSVESQSQPELKLETQLTQESEQELPSQPESKTQPLFCISCGAKLEADSNFCIHCGVKIVK